MLNDRDIELFERLLRDTENRILADYRHLTEEALENFNDSRSPQHLAELGTDAYEREFSLRFAESDQHALEEIRDAIRRIDEGTYGLCEDCLATGRSNTKAAIPKTRLREIPYARTCVACEREREARKPG